MGSGEYGAVWEDDEEAWAAKARQSMAVDCAGMVILDQDSGRWENTTPATTETSDSEDCYEAYKFDGEGGVPPPSDLRRSCSECPDTSLDTIRPCSPNNSPGNLVRTLLHPWELCRGTGDFLSAHEAGCVYPIQHLS